MTRVQVAKSIGRSISTVRRLEGHVLHPVPDGRGVNRFDEAEVAELAELMIRTGRTPPAEPEVWWDNLDAEGPRLCDEHRQLTEELEREVSEQRRHRERAERRLVEAERRRERLETVVARGIVALASRFPEVAGDAARLLRGLERG